MQSLHLWESETDLITQLQRGQDDQVDINGCENIVHRDPEAARQFLALAHRPGLDDVEATKEHKDSEDAQCAQKYPAFGQ